MMLIPTYYNFTVAQMSKQNISFGSSDLPPDEATREGAPVPVSSQRVLALQKMGAT